MSLSGDTIPGRIVRRVATATDSDPLELPPLYEAIDPDTLDSLVEGMADGELSFAYAGYQVSVDSVGTVSVDVRPAGSPATEQVTSGD